MFEIYIYNQIYDYVKKDTCARSHKGKRYLYKYNFAIVICARSKAWKKKKKKKKERSNNSMD